MLEIHLSAITCNSITACLFFYKRVRYLTESGTQTCYSSHTILWYSWKPRRYFLFSMASTQAVLLTKRAHIFFLRGRCMARGRKTSLTIHLTPAQRQTLMVWQRATTIPAGRARRGRIILLVADRVPIAHIATTVGISRRFVYKWVRRFQQAGLEGLADQPGRGHRRVPSPPALQEQHGVRA